MKRNDNRMDQEIADRLRREAMAERPPFSPALHDRIMQQVHGESSAGNAPMRIPAGRRLAAAAVAAAILLACGLSIYWALCQQSAPSSYDPARIVSAVNRPEIDLRQPAEAAEQDSSALTVNFGGIPLGSFQPQGMLLRLPVAGTNIPLVSVQVSADTATIPVQSDLPEWLLALLQEPARNANGVLADIIPADVRQLLGLDG
jgi:hypothetical protein